MQCKQRLDYYNQPTTQIRKELKVTFSTSTMAARLVSFSQVSTGILDMGKLQDLKVVATIEFEYIN